MKNRLTQIFRYSSHIYKVLLVLGSVLLLLYLFPNKEKFPYQYRAGRIWTYADFFAPMDFSVREPSDLVRRRKDSIRRNYPVFVRELPLDTAALHRRIDRSLQGPVRLFGFSDGKNARQKAADRIFNDLYGRLVLPAFPDSLKNHPVWLLRGKQVIPLDTSRLVALNHIKAFMLPYVRNLSPDDARKTLGAFFRLIKPTAKLDPEQTQKYLNAALESVRPSEEIIYKGQKIVSSGERITPHQVRILDTLKGIYASDQRNYTLMRLGFALISLIFFGLFLFYLYLYEPEIYTDNSALTLIFLNFLLVAGAVFLVQRYRPSYIYAVPFIILPVIIQTFFNRRIALAVLIVGAALTGLGVSHTTEFALIQIAAGWAALLSMRNMTKRSEMFLSVMQVVVVYLLVYTGYYLIRQGDWHGMDWRIFAMFFASGILAVVLLHDLILLFEKSFGLASDVSLLELLNTNSKLLRQLAEKAPGTFQHSVQVANLAEAIANEVGANALLVRVGALYHDIGKMKNPKYFTENQTSGHNPHENLDPRESARIIIRHVLDGIEMARRYNIPERIIDFIRTHHGKSLVYYFYAKAREQNPDVPEADFRYPGPNPFSRETAILMMSDSVEAASKSLKNPTSEQIDALVDKIIERQLQEGLLMNSDLSLKEINRAKKVLKTKLKNIYHLRVSYPDRD